MKKVISLCLLLCLTASVVIAQPSAEEIYESMLRAFDPALIRQAEERGLYDREAFPILRAMNPFFIRGDFDGNGELDIAFWVQNGDTGERGVAILHSTLNRMYIFGAGRSRPDPQGASSTQVWVDAWHLVPVGQTETHPFNDIPEIGVREGQPFTLERETLEFVNLGKSAFVFYWANGKYWEFWTAD